MPFVLSHSISKIFLIVNKILNWPVPIPSIVQPISENNLLKSSSACVHQNLHKIVKNPTCQTPLHSLIKASNQPLTIRP